MSDLRKFVTAPTLDEAEAVVKHIEELIEVGDVGGVCNLLNTRHVFETLDFSFRYDELPILFLGQIKNCLDDPKNTMEKRPYDLADARMQVIRFYRNLEIHDIRLWWWVVSVEGSFLRMIRTLGLCATPHTIF